MSNQPKPNANKIKNQGVGGRGGKRGGPGPQGPRKNDQSKPRFPQNSSRGGDVEMSPDGTQHEQPSHDNNYDSRGPVDRTHSAPPVRGEQKKLYVPVKYNPPPTTFQQASSLPSNFAPGPHQNIHPNHPGQHPNHPQNHPQNHPPPHGGHPPPHMNMIPTHNGRPPMYSKKHPHPHPPNMIPMNPNMPGMVPPNMPPNMGPPMNPNMPPNMMSPSMPVMIPNNMMHPGKNMQYAIRGQPYPPMMPPGYPYDMVAAGYGPYGPPPHRGFMPPQMVPIVRPYPPSPMHPEHMVMAHGPPMVPPMAHPVPQPQQQHEPKQRTSHALDIINPHTKEKVKAPDHPNPARSLSPPRYQEVNKHGRSQLAVEVEGGHPRSAPHKKYTTQDLEIPTYKPKQVQPVPAAPTGNPGRKVSPNGLRRDKVPLKINPAELTIPSYQELLRAKSPERVPSQAVSAPEPAPVLTPRKMSALKINAADLTIPSYRPKGVSNPEMKAAKEVREKQERERTEKVRLEKEVKEKHEREQKEKEEKEKREKEEREAQEKAEKEAREEAEAEEAERVAREAKEKAEQEERERVEKEEREAREQAEKERVEQEAKEKAEQEERERLEKEAKEKAEQEERERVEQEAKEKEERERLEKEKAATPVQKAPVKIQKRKKQRMKEIEEKGIAAATRDAYAEQKKVVVPEPEAVAEPEAVPEPPAPEPESSEDDDWETKDQDEILDKAGKAGDDLKPTKWVPHLNGNKVYPRGFLLQFERMFTEKPEGWSASISFANIVNESEETKRKISGTGKKSDAWRSNTPRSTASKENFAGRGGKGGHPNDRDLSPGHPRGRKTKVQHPKIEVPENPNRWQRPKKDTDETETFRRTIRQLLNKITPENFEKLFAELSVPFIAITNYNYLEIVVDLIFEKALNETNYCEMYATLCFSLVEIPDAPCFQSGPEEKLDKNFRRAIITSCQRAFEVKQKPRAPLGIEGQDLTPEEKMDAEAKAKKLRDQNIGNIKFIGALFKKQVLSEIVMHRCLTALVAAATLEENQQCNEDVEDFCHLMNVVGYLLDTEKAEGAMNYYFKTLEELLATGRVIPRIKFTFQNLQELRAQKWVPKKKLDMKAKSSDKGDKKRTNRY